MSPPNAKAISAGWKDKQGYWTSTDDNYFVIGYNTRLVSERDAPRDWEDLLLPRWRGQIGFDPDNHLLFGGLEQSWGREKALLISANSPSSKSNFARAIP